MNKKAILIVWVLVLVVSLVSFLLLTGILDAGRRELVDGEKQLQQGEQRLEKGKERLQAGKHELSSVQTVYHGSTKSFYLIAAALPIAGTLAVAAGNKMTKKKIAEGKSELYDGEKKIHAGEQQLSEGVARLHQGKKLLLLAEFLRFVCVAGVLISGVMIVFSSSRDSKKSILKNRFKRWRS